MNTKEVFIPLDIYEKVEAIETNLDKEFLYYIIHLIQNFDEIARLEIPEIGAKGFTAIACRFMQNKKDNYLEYLYLLENVGIIEINHSYKVKKEIRKYRNKKLYRKTSVKGYPKSYRLLIPTDKEIVFDVFEIGEERINQYSPYFFTDQYFDELKPEVANQKQIIKSNISIDPQFEKLQESLKKKEAKRELTKGYTTKLFEPIYKLKSGSFLPTMGITRRIVTPFVRLTSLFRYYVQIDGEPLVEMDLSNSQMFFLYLLIQKKQPELLTRRDVKKYGKLVCEGNFYEEIEKKYKTMFPDVEVSRNLIKQTVMQAFFSKEITKRGNMNHFRKNTRLVFQKHFPNVYQFIKDTKARSYRHLSRELQRMESGIFIFDLFKMAHEFNYLTVHDAVYCKVSDIEAMKKKLEEIFENKYGIMPNIKMKLLQKPTAEQVLGKIKEKRNLDILLCNKML